MCQVSFRWHPQGGADVLLLQCSCMDIEGNLLLCSYLSCAVRRVWMLVTKRGRVCVDLSKYIVGSEAKIMLIEVTTDVAKCGSVRFKLRSRGAVQNSAGET